MFKRVLERIGKRGSALGCVIGLGVGVGLFALILTLPFALIYLMPLFTFLPDQLGLFQEVASEDVVNITVTTFSAYELEIREPGDYAVFSVSPTMQRLREQELIGLRSRETGEKISLTPIENWFGPDDRVVAGEPIYEFHVGRPGVYEVSIQNLSGEREFMLSVIPNFSDRNRSVFSVSCLGQSCVLLLLGAMVYYQRNRGRIRGEKVEKQEKMDRFEDWIRKERGDG